MLKLYLSIFPFSSDHLFLFLLPGCNIVQFSSFGAGEKKLRGHSRKHKTFVEHLYNVFDIGPTLYKCYTNKLCLLGCHDKYQSLRS